MRDAVLSLCKRGLLTEALKEVARACDSTAALALGKLVHARILWEGSESDAFLATSLVDMYCKCGSLAMASHVFRRMPSRSVVSWTALICGYARMGRGPEALQLFWCMPKCGTDPNPVTCACVASVCAGLAEGRLLHSLIVEYGLASDVFLNNALINMYARCNNIEGACGVFAKMPTRDVVTWNSIIAGSAQHGHGMQALQLFWQMQELGMKPDQFTFSSVLSACASMKDLSEGKQIHSQIIQAGLETNIYVGTALIGFYGKCGQIFDARKLFHKMPTHDLYMWTAIISTICQHGDGKETLELFQQMLSEGVKPDHFIFSSVLRACADLAALTQGKQVHIQIIKSGLDKHIFVSAALVDMYAKCGSIDDAYRVFRNMPKRDLVSWNVLFAGCAQHGCGKRALELFQKMLQEKIEPDGFTFSTILSACSHAGMLHEGCFYFDLMCRNHGLVPTVEHYTCMVDLLGRAGLLHEAEDFINRMPLQPSTLLWMSFLSACKIYDNMDLAVHATENILKLEPENATALVLLTNVHGASSKTEVQSQWQECV